MTLNEAIDHAESVAQKQREKGCLECAEDHEQLATWLKDYKQILDKGEIRGRDDNGVLLPLLERP